MLRRTPLFEAHRLAGARMVDFGGWEMPLHYGSQIEEHLAVRASCGMFDVSHMRVIDLAGADSLVFLRRLLANDAARLVPGKALYSCMLQQDGGIIDDLIVYRLEDGGAVHYRIVVNAASAERDLAWMQQVLDQDGHRASLLARPDLGLIAVQGPTARARLVQAAPHLEMSVQDLGVFCARQVGDWFVARTGYTGEDGCEIALPAGAAVSLWGVLQAAQVRACGLGARDTLRLEAGMSLCGADMDASVTPLESGLAWTVSIGGVRDFIGRAALERQLRGGPLRQLLGIKLAGGGVLRAHQAVSTSRGEGVITSGSFSPTMGCSIALARLPADVRPGEEVSVALRAGPAAASVCRPPFVRNGRVLV